MAWTKNGNGNYDFDAGRQFGVPNTFYRIAIEEKRSRFAKSRVRYNVVALGNDERGYFKDFFLKRFTSRNAAQNFADNLAALLNEQVD